MKTKTRISIFYPIILLTSTLCWGCTSSTQTKREETTTTRQVDTVIVLPASRTSGESDNYLEWRKWIIPILAFAPDTVQPWAHFLTPDSMDFYVNLRTGKTTVETKAKPIPIKVMETQTHVTEEKQAETKSWLNEFGHILLYAGGILLILLLGFIAYKFR